MDSWDAECFKIAHKAMALGLTLKESNFAAKVFESAFKKMNRDWPKGWHVKRGKVIARLLSYAFSVVLEEDWVK